MCLRGYIARLIAGRSDRMGEIMARSRPAELCLAPRYLGQIRAANAPLDQGGKIPWERSTTSMRPGPFSPSFCRKGGPRELYAPEPTKIFPHQHAETPVSERAIRILSE